MNECLWWQESDVRCAPVQVRPMLSIWRICRDWNSVRDAVMMSIDTCPTLRLPTVCIIGEVRAVSLSDLVFLPSSFEKVGRWLSNK